MHKIELHIANATGALDPYLAMINSEFKTARGIAEKTIGASGIDIIVNDRPEQEWPQLASGGEAISSKLIIVSLYVNKKITPLDLLGTFLHEIHHATRYQALDMEWKDMTLFDYLVVEGLGTLYEEQCTGITPAPAKAKIIAKTLKQAKRHFADKDFDSDKWFANPDKTFGYWFGYAYGYQIARKASIAFGKTAAEMVAFPAEKFLPFI